MQKKKRLVYILHDIAIGGVEVALLSAIPLLTEKYDLKVIVLGTINPKLIAHFTEDQQAVFHTFSYPVLLYPFYMRKIVHYIVELKPHIMICSLWRAMLVGVLVKKRHKQVKFFSFIHSVTFFHFLSKRYTIRAIKNSDVVLTDSDSSFQFINNNFKLNCPIRCVSFMTHTPPPYIKRGPLDRDKPIKFMFLGRVDKVKNLPAVIHVISYLREKGYDAVLDIYGRKENAYSEVSALVATKKLEQSIYFKGEIQPAKKFELFNQYDFYIQLSFVEGMAMSVAEAMQHGLPCIVTAVGEIPNYSTDMQSVLFIDIVNKENWIPSLQKIQRVIDHPDLYDSISKNAWSNFQGRKVYAESLLENIEL